LIELIKFIEFKYYRHKAWRIAGSEATVFLQNLLDLGYYQLSILKEDVSWHIKNQLKEEDSYNYHQLPSLPALPVS